MAIVEILPSLIKEIEAHFKKQGVEILEYLKSLENSPHKGKVIGIVGGVIIKELKYNNFRFYFIADAFKLKCFDAKELTDLLLTFVRMSGKKDQQKVIDEIRRVLVIIGPAGFE